MKKMISLEFIQNFYLVKVKVTGIGYKLLVKKLHLNY
ncbi:hypothetical protein SAMN05444672_103191 [Bacillus sp. OK838]|nr:hypothetical protein SAMN05444672_103191 [Bacillus sp. OK838]